MIFCASNKKTGNIKCKETQASVTSVTVGHDTDQPKFRVCKVNLATLKVATTENTTTVLVSESPNVEHLAGGRNNRQENTHALPGANLSLPSSPQVTCSMFSWMVFFLDDEFGRSNLQLCKFLSYSYFLIGFATEASCPCLQASRTNVGRISPVTFTARVSEELGKN